MGTFSLQGLVALVTGASGVIGGAIATELHRAGARVVISGTRADRLDALQSELGEGCGQVVGDLVDAATPALLVAAAEAQFGKCDILVCNAGATADGLALRMKDDDWGRVLQLNLTASFGLARAALRGMAKRRFGRIVAIGSVVGSMGNAGQANYAASKAGLGGMIRSLAIEFAGRCVTANMVAPGMVTSPMTEGLSDVQRAAMLSRIPMGRAGEPGEIAHTVRFLASPEAAYITGTTLHVNGGMYTSP